MASQANGAVPEEALRIPIEGIAWDEPLPNVPTSEAGEAAQLVDEPTVEAQPQSAATGSSQTVTSRSMPASSAAPAQPTLTVAQMEENITRRLMEAMSTKLEQLVIQQTAQTQQSPQQIPQQRRQQQRPQQQTERDAPDEEEEDATVQPDPWARSAAVAAAAAPITDQGQTSGSNDTNWNNNGWNWGWQNNNWDDNDWNQGWWKRDDDERDRPYLSHLVFQPLTEEEKSIQRTSMTL